MVEVTGTFDVRIALRNDNAPRRAVDRPLYVVDGGGRLLGVDDVAFTDPDVDFDSARLEYEWRDIDSVGQLVLADNRQVARRVVSCTSTTYFIVEKKPLIISAK